MRQPCQITRYHYRDLWLDAMDVCHPVTSLEPKTVMADSTELLFFDTFSHESSEASRLCAIVYASELHFMAFYIVFNKCYTLFCNSY